jgi:uridine monophosphate synthetase
MTTFFELLESRVREIDSLLCVGLDPRPEDLASYQGRTISERLSAFCLQLMEATREFAAAYKPNAAFFEIHGADGIRALKEIIAMAPPGIPVILDAKRGDIASSAVSYARAAFEQLGAGAVTVSPYLGADSLEPFLDDPARGVFVLCKTSNPGSADLQDLRLTGEPGIQEKLYERVASLANNWSRYDNLGLVVGATQPQALAGVREKAPGLWILAPGVGAQGGDLKSALQGGLRADGVGLLVNVSRGISRAGDPHEAARNIRQAINREREAIMEGERKRTVAGQTPEPLDQSLADRLLEAGCVRFGRFTLKSGLQSPIYIDLRRLAAHPRLLEMVAEAYLPLLKGLDFDHLAPLPYAALPIGTAISLLGGWPMVYPRKEPKSYGTGVEVEGEFSPGERVVVIDDLVTTGGSKFEAIEKLTSAGLRVEDVVVLIDRQSGARQALESAGLRLHAVYNLSQLLDYWGRTSKVDSESLGAVRDFLQNSAGD